MGAGSIPSRAPRAPGVMRVLGLATLTVSLVGLSGGNVLAEPPGNDDRADASVVTAVPYEDTVDTTEATHQASDPCTDGDPFRTVWYSFTPSQEGRFAIRLQAEDEDYGAIFALAVPDGSGGLDIINCDWGGGTMTWRAEAGQEYLIMLGTWPDSSSGVVHLAVLRPPRSPWVLLSVADTGRVGRLGAALVAGRVRCPPRAGGAQVSVRVRQEFGRFIVVGRGSTGAACGERWTARAPNSAFRFAAGEARVQATAYVCTEYDCARRSVRKTVILH
jgi:hypothetical protein